MLSPTDRNRVDPVSLYPWPSSTFGNQSAAIGCGYYGARTTHRHTIHGAYDTGARARQRGICYIQRRRLSGRFLFGLIAYPRGRHRSFLDKRESAMSQSAISQSIISLFIYSFICVFNLSYVLSFLPLIVIFYSLQNSSLIPRPFLFIHLFRAERYILLLFQPAR